MLLLIHSIENEKNEMIQIAWIDWWRIRLWHHAHVAINKWFSYSELIVAWLVSWLLSLSLTFLLLLEITFSFSEFGLCRFACAAALRTDVFQNYSVDDCAKAVQTIAKSQNATNSSDSDGYLYRIRNKNFKFILFIQLDWPFSD